MNLKRLAITLFVFAVILFVWNYQGLTKAPLPCKEPIAYAIGIFDRRFGISQREFLGALSEAEAIWEKPSGLELFVYAPEGAEMAINLIYDYRQEVTSALSGLGSTVKEDEATYQALRAQYVNLKTEYGSAKSLYDARLEVFNEKVAAYQKKIESWNRGKRTSREQFDQLENDRITLEVEVAELKIEETRLNGMVQKINTLVETLNRLADALNLNVETYNTIGASRGETFTGGIYYNDSEREGIDIYEFSDRDKLVRVLAHELGHALGLEHVSDKEAIMYHLNKGDAGDLTKTDLAVLESLCYTK